MTTALIVAALVVVWAVGARVITDWFARRFHLRVGRWSKILPGWREIGCGRCGTSWRYVRPHATTGVTARGTFTMAPLCDPCWRELGTAAARITFYTDEFVLRVAHGERLTPTQLVAIRAAVATGL